MSQNLRSLPPPLPHNVTLRQHPPPSLTCDVIYGCPLIHLPPIIDMANVVIIKLKIQSHLIPESIPFETCHPQPHLTVFHCDVIYEKAVE